MLNADGIEGDWQRNRVLHGGPNRAVLMIGAELVDALIAGGFPICYGALGENLTVSGLDPHLWRAGQRYRIGVDAVIELTTLRQPCSSLNIYGPAIKDELYDAQAKARDIRSPHWAHGGFYAKVVRSGLLVAGARVELESELA